MKKIFLIITAVFVFQELLTAQISKADHDTLFSNLPILNHGRNQTAIDKIENIFRKPYTCQDFTIFFDEYYSLNSINSDFVWLMENPLFYNFNGADELVSKYNLQLANKITLINKINIF